MRGPIGRLGAGNLDNLPRPVGQDAPQAPDEVPVLRVHQLDALAGVAPAQPLSPASSNRNSVLTVRGIGSCRLIYAGPQP